MNQTDRTTLIAGLNEDLAHEYASVIQYRTFASTVRGPHRLVLRPMFAAEIADELAHAELLADYIVALGGVPITTPAPVPVADDAESMLRSVLEAESAALARYVERRRLAEAAGAHALAVALDEVIADETRHRDETGLVLDGWRSARERDQPRAALPGVGGSSIAKRGRAAIPSAPRSRRSAALP